MKRGILIVFILIMVIGCYAQSGKEQYEIDQEFYVDVLMHIKKKMKLSLSAFEPVSQNPRGLNNEGELEMVKSSDWTSGFYPGCLWMIYGYSNDTVFLSAAKKHTEILEAEKNNGKTHDMGFKMFCSYGKGYELVKNSSYAEILLESAKTLIGRYNENVGCIRSWDHNTEKWQFPVIIDNMMNLELLMWAFKETSDSIYRNIAISHANQTIKNHFRNNFSTYHVIDYDTISGKVLKKNTHQGFNDESCWARGQAWGLYGFVMMYRETYEENFLRQAEHIAQYIINYENLPKDMIPYWDFDAPDIPDKPRDASAAAIMCSALIELSGFSKTNKEQYIKTAEKILCSLASDDYLLKINDKNPFILDHSTGNYPQNSEIDVPLIYADYYFTEALIRMLELRNEYQ